MSAPQNDNAGPLQGLPHQGNPDLVALLETTLQAARAGQVTGLALVTVTGPESLNCAAVGAFPATMAAGCRKTARQLEDALFAKRSSILRPGRTG
jgi:hypothetical protein